MPADLVFVNGPVFTAGPARSFVRALAVTGDRITAMGDETEVFRSIGDATRVVDLAGRLMTPGFQDAHCHPGSSGLDLLRPYNVVITGSHPEYDSVEMLDAFEEIFAGEYRAELPPLRKP